MKSENKLSLIATFMGMEFFPTANYGNEFPLGGFKNWSTQTDIWVVNPTPEFRQHLMLSHPEEFGLDHDFQLTDGWHITLKYDISWDWLIPVIKKLYDVWEINWSRSNLNDVLYHYTRFDIKKTFLNVADCIQLINTHA